MEKTEGPSLVRPERPFTAEIATVLLIVFMVIELASIFGWSPGVTSNFPYPLDKIMGLASFFMGLLGIYGLLRNNKVGTYFALLAAVFEGVLGGFSLVKAYGTSQSSLALVTSAIIALVLGPLTLICIFKTIPKREIVNTTPGASSLLTPKTPLVGDEKYAIETIDVTKKYFLGLNIVSAINGLSMRVRKGEFIAIMGASGSGKSTLLNLIGALDKPTSGKVLIDGVDISTLDEEGLARLRNEKIGFVFQAYNLIARSTVLRNMELPAFVKGYPKEEQVRKINNLLTVVGLGDKAPRKPKTLSGGEQQRVAIARALVNDPEIVLADEPTGNVDSKTGRVVMGFLRELNLERGTTVIVVTHDAEVAAMADRIVHLKDGKIIEEEMVGGVSI